MHFVPKTFHMNNNKKNMKIPNSVIFFELHELFAFPLETAYWIGLALLDFIAKYKVKRIWTIIDEYVSIDKIFTAGLVVIKRAYLLNLVCPNSLGIKSWRFPNKWPIRNKTKNKPDSAATVFRNKLDVKNESNFYIPKHSKLQILYIIKLT